MIILQRVGGEGGWSPMVNGQNTMLQLLATDIFVSRNQLNTGNGGAVFC